MTSTPGGGGGGKSGGSKRGGGGGGATEAKRNLPKSNSIESLKTTLQKKTVSQLSAQLARIKGNTDPKFYKTQKWTKSQIINAIAQETKIIQAVKLG